jgi:hypothetical protein
MDFFNPWLLPQLPDFSRQTVGEMAQMILNYSSITSPRTPACARVASVLFPDTAFTYPTVLWDWLWPFADRVIDQINLWIESGQPNDGRWGLSDSDYKALKEYPLAVQGRCMWYLWGAAVQIYFFLKGPDEFRPNVYTLRDLKPYSEPSQRMARYIRDVLGKDLTAAWSIISQITESYQIQPASEFPRISLFGG